MLVNDGVVLVVGFYKISIIEFVRYGLRVCFEVYIGTIIFNMYF